MFRYWVSWWTGYYADEGCTKPPFTVWTSGERDQRKDGRDEVSLCAVLDAPNEVSVWAAVKHYFPDVEQRFCEIRPSDFKPGDRFRGDFAPLVPAEFYQDEDGAKHLVS